MDFSVINVKREEKLQGCFFVNHVMNGSPYSLWNFLKSISGQSSIRVKSVGVLHATQNQRTKCRGYKKLTLFDWPFVRTEHTNGSPSYST